MTKHRRAARVDNNQSEIVRILRSIPGVSVETGKDDILVGRNGFTYWYEIKSDRAVSNKTGKVYAGCTQKSQKRLKNDFKGHYRVVSSVEEILEEIGINV